MIKNFNLLKFFAAFIAFLLLNLFSTQAQNGPACDNYNNVKATIPTGLSGDTVYGIYVEGSMVYAATNIGLSISTNGGSSFTAVNDLNYQTVNDVSVSGSTVYAATNNGLYISTDGGATFTFKFYASVYGVYASGSTVYAATNDGLRISTDGGATFTKKTTTNGLGNDEVRGVYASGSTVYAATTGGVSISTNGGSSFTNKTTSNGLGNNMVRDVYASGSTVYAATVGGLSITMDGGTSFINYSTANGLGANFVRGVYVSGTTVYTATESGLSISTDGGTSFTNYTTANGLGSNDVNEVYASGNTVYAATSGGLSISTDGGTTFVNKTSTIPSGSGLGSDNLTGVFANGNVVYVATGGGLSISTNGGASFTNKTTTNGLGANNVNGVCVSGSTIYAPTSGGLSISTDGGASFTNKTTTNGLANDYVTGVFAVGSTIYAATFEGLSISSDGGASFTNRTTTDGLASNYVFGVCDSGSSVYAAVYGGVSISTDGGVSFTNRTTTDGLGSDFVNGVYASGSTVYAATSGGLSISTDGGTSFTNYTTANGLGDNNVTGVYASGSTVYATSYGGLSISMDGGATFTNYTTANGLGSNNVSGVYASGNTVFLATMNGLSFCSAAAATPDTPVVSVENNCGTATLSTTATGSLLWSTGATTSSITVSTAGDYTVTQTVSNVASAAGTGTAAPITVPAKPTITAGGATTFCSGGSVVLTASTGTTYLWSNGATTQSITATTAGSYTVQITNASGCQSVASVATVVTVTPKPSAPAKVNSWDNFVFNTTSCAWDNTGTPTNSTTILDSQCGSTLAAISTILSAYPVANATAYKFKIVTSGTNAIRYYSSSTGSFNLTQVTGSLYNTTYTLSVAATIGGVLKAYGATCTVTTPTVPLSKVQDSQCGVTLAALSTVIVPVAVPLAQGYKYKVTNIATNEVNFYTRSKTATFALSQRADAGSGSVAIKLSSTYSVAVAVKINGVFSAYGDACLVSTPLLPTTKIHDALCGTTLASINSYLYLKAGVAGSTGYRLKATQGNEVRTCDRTVVNMYYPFEFKQLTGGAAYATTYELSVSVFYNGAWQPYGATCTVTTPAAPQSKLAISQCGITLNKTNTNVLTASSVAVAQAYRFEVSKGTSTYTVETTSGSLRTFKLTEVPGLTLESGATYGIRVAIKANGVWQPYGASCNVTTYGSPAIGKMADPLAKPETVFNALAYPNPFSSAFQLKLDTSSKAAVDLEVYDVLGRLIENRQWKGAETTEQEMGNNYPSGIYNIILNQGGNVKTLRVIKR